MNPNNPVSTKDYMSQSSKAEKNTLTVQKNNKMIELCLDYWNKIDLYKSLNERNATKFVTQDGPPYANGPIHMGHAANKIIKDSINKIKCMSGYALDFLTGWDCHGLPIEMKVEEEFKKKGLHRHDIPTLELIDACKEYAEKWINIQREAFAKIGICCDKKYYTTMNQENQLDIVSIIHKFANSGLIYRDLKPIMWSCEEETALAEAEIEYKEKQSTAVDCALKIYSSNLDLLKDKAYIPIWTTTPWTLPANKAIAYNPELEYCLLKLSEEPGIREERIFIVAKELCENFIKRCSIKNFEIIAIIKGSELAHTTYVYPFDDKIVQSFIPSDHVNNNQGTGFVHIAPDFGEEDFKLSKEYNLSCCEYINNSGHFKHNIPDNLEFIRGKFFAASEKLIIKYLGDNILSATPFLHQYPHSWRSRKPIIYRAVNQWFIAIEKPENNLKERGISEANNAQWMPKNAQDRFITTLKARETWCCSRQRKWGTPICLFHKNGELLLDSKVLENTIKYLSENGVYVWHNEETREKILKDEYQEYEKITDIIDVWFESGCVQDFTLKARNIHPADLYIEGQDQIRAYFQSSMLVSLVSANAAPYKAVKIHGFVVDSQGNKMSKSLENGADPIEVVDKFGQDILRLWVLAQDTSNDISFGMKQINDCEKIFRRVRNTLKFLITNGKPYNIEYKDYPILEQYILHRVYEISKICAETEQSLKMHRILHAIYSFCETDLSRFYFDIRKDILYREEGRAKEKTQNCLNIVFHYMVRWLAPIMSFTAEEAWQIYHLNERKDLDLSPNKAQENSENINKAADIYYDCDNWTSSIHLETFLKPDELWNNLTSYQKVKKMFDLRHLVNIETEQLRNPNAGKKFINSELKNDKDSHNNTDNLEIELHNKHLHKPESMLKGNETQNNSAIKSSLDCKVQIYLPRDYDLDLDYQKELKEICMVSNLELISDPNLKEIKVVAEKATGYKCDKCKYWHPNQTLNSLCIRCYGFFKSNNDYNF